MLGGVLLFSHSHLNSHFARSLAAIPEVDKHYEGCLVDVEDVLEAHYYIVDYFVESNELEKKVGGIGPKDVGLLCSAVARQLWAAHLENEFEVCASLLYGLIQNHPFHDCNKRTAILSAFYFLTKSKRIPCDSHIAFEKLTVNIARRKLGNYTKYKKLLKKENGEVKVIAALLKEKTRPQEYDKPRITFNDLNKLLKRNGYALRKPSGGFIDVVSDEEKSSFMKRVLGKTSKIRIVFKGWKSEVHEADLDRLKRITGLTPQNGFDSKVFYRGEACLPALIEEYSDMLRRLADK